MHNDIPDLSSNLKMRSPCDEIRVRNILIQGVIDVLGNASKVDRDYVLDYLRDLSDHDRIPWSMQYNSHGECPSED